MSDSRLRIHAYCVVFQFGIVKIVYAEGMWWFCKRWGNGEPCIAFSKRLDTGVVMTAQYQPYVTVLDDPAMKLVRLTIRVRVSFTFLGPYEVMLNMYLWYSRGVFQHTIELFSLSAHTLWEVLEHFIVIERNHAVARNLNIIVVFRENATSECRMVVIPVDDYIRAVD